MLVVSQWPGVLVTSEKRAAWGPPGCSSGNVSVLVRGLMKRPGSQPPDMKLGL